MIASSIAIISREKTSLNDEWIFSLHFTLNSSCDEIHKANNLPPTYLSPSSPTMINASKYLQNTTTIESLLMRMALAKVNSIQFNLFKASWQLQNCQRQKQAPAFWVGKKSEENLYK